MKLEDKLIIFSVIILVGSMILFQAFINFNENMNIPDDIAIEEASYEDFDWDLDLKELIQPKIQ